MQELIKLTQQTLNNEQVNTVNARELHEFLGVGRDFSTWFKDRVEQYSFVENEDYVLIPQNGGTNSGRGGDRKSKDYHISLDMAKELCMVERNEKGREARKYFIECEKKQAKALKAISEVTLDLSTSLVVYRNGDYFVSSVDVAKYIGIQHKNILRDIRAEINQLKSESIETPAFEAILDGFKETSYIDDRGRTQVAYDLNEVASYQLLLKYSAKFRAEFILQFKRMKDAIIDMFKLKVIDQVLPEHKGKRQYVYIIKNIDTDNIKVGVATDPYKRLAQLQTGSDSDLALIYTSYLCSNAFQVETKVHSRFEDKHVRGEWFKIDPVSVVAFLETSRFVLSSDLDLSFDSKLVSLIKSDVRGSDGTRTSL